MAAPPDLPPSPALPARDRYDRCDENHQSDRCDRSDRSDSCDGCPALCWQLRRNCRLTPRQMGVAFGVVCVFHGLLALGFWALGFPLVSLFAGIEVAVLAAALVVHARHVLDRETITLAADRLCVERHCGGRVERIELPAAWVRVHSDGPAALVRLSAGERSVCVGRHLVPAQRPLMARELRRALAGTQRPAEDTLKT